MKSFSHAFSRIGTESAFSVGPEIAGWVNRGYDMVRLNIGEPGDNIPQVSTKAIIESVKRHETHYMPAAGTDSLREEIANYLSITRRVKYKKEDIVVSPGGKPVIGGTIQILVDPGDEVIYPTPGYPIYESFVDLVGAVKKPIILKEEKSFRFDISDLKKLVSAKTKLLILNSPSNPTGGVLTKEDLEEVAKLANKYDFYILSDECYSRVIFGKGFRKVNFKGNKIPVAPSIVNISGMAERTVILHAFSKTYCMTGLRVGFAASKIKDFMSKFTTFAINYWSCLPAPIMAGALAALGKSQKEAQSVIADYQDKRDMAVEMLNDIRDIKCHKPEGSFYLFPNVTEVCKRKGFANSETLRKHLLSFDKKKKRGVAVLARIHFGKPLPGEREDYIRLCFAGKKDLLAEGIRRIKEAVE